MLLCSVTVDYSFFFSYEFVYLLFEPLKVCSPDCVEMSFTVSLFPEYVSHEQYVRLLHDLPSPKL